MAEGSPAGPPAIHVESRVSRRRFHGEEMTPVSQILVGRWRWTLGSEVLDHVARFAEKQSRSRSSRSRMKGNSFHRPRDGVFDIKCRERQRLSLRRRDWYVLSARCLEQQDQRWQVHKGTMNQ
jgi:hypothetical protein